jgi:pimeloyl-ACP methyl ester carboxylesterase
MSNTVRVHRPEQGVRFVEANGLRFGYLEWGAGPLLLLFHGFPDTARTWERTAPELAKAGFRVVAPFLRGYAPTQMPPRDVDTRTLGEDVLALIGALGGHKARLIGHDFGADAVYAAAALGPERIERMVTVGIPHRAALTPTPSLGWALRHFLTLSLPGAQARFARDDYAMVDVLCRRWSPTWRFTADDLEPVKNAFASPGCLHAALGYYRATELRTPGFMRAKVTVPTLSIAGADDPGISPAVYEGVRKQFQGHYQVTVIGGGHYCHRESPEAFLAAVTRFLG